MFVVEFRTISSTAAQHPSQFFNVGSHKAQSEEQAKELAFSRLGPNVEIMRAQYVGSL